MKISAVFLKAFGTKSEVDSILSVVTVKKYPDLHIDSHDLDSETASVSFHVVDPSNGFEKRTAIVRDFSSRFDVTTEFDHQGRRDRWLETFCFGKRLGQGVIVKGEIRGAMRIRLEGSIMEIRHFSHTAAGLYAQLADPPLAVARVLQKSVISERFQNTVQLDGKEISEDELRSFAADLPTLWVSVEGPSR